MNIKRFIIVIVCFLTTSILIYGGTESYGVEKARPLLHVITGGNGWETGEFIPLDQGIVQELRLDDYINKNFTKNGDRAFLYIGYYLTSKNVGAAHSPPVCFPGQGWLLTDFEEKTLITTAGNINLMTIVASTPQNKQLLIYWFQAFEQTFPGTFMQKINLIRSRLINEREDNAFVRVTVPLDKQSVNQAYAIGADFIRAFYPDFLKHVQQSNS